MQADPAAGDIGLPGIEKTDVGHRIAANGGIEIPLDLRRDHDLKRIFADRTGFGRAGRIGTVIDNQQRSRAGHGSVDITRLHADRYVQRLCGIVIQRQRLVEQYRGVQITGCGIERGRQIEFEYGAGTGAGAQGLIGIDQRESHRNTPGTQSE